MILLKKIQKIDLWPTTIYQTHIDNIDCETLRALILNNECLGKNIEDLFSEGSLDFIKTSLSSIGNVNITDAWTRTVELHCSNEFEVHCDSHKGSDYIGILWITGENNVGGDLVLYDPSWKNPQHIRHESKQTYSNYKIFKFSVGNFILFPSNVWHKITAYNGNKERISLNFAINIDGFDN